jgi:hypothetical protein
MVPRRNSTTDHGGYRSSLEKSIGEALEAQGTPFEYESFGVPYEPIKKVLLYKPDFILPNGIVVEAKGYFLSKDRQKHKAVLQQYPDLDLRFLFPRPDNKLAKGSATTYADWCNDLGIKWAQGKVIPQSWLDEPPNPKSLEVIHQLKLRASSPKRKKT